MGTKNNPENRGLVTELRTYDGKKVKPILYINGNRRFMAGVYEDNGDLVTEKASGDPIPYGSMAVGA
ncbi:MAG: hypothetical protein P8P30_03700 [Rickettsiales bacterium]|nr:hypothetical protein [Rickettsiales bacterium]